MTWGTDFKTAIFLSHEIFHSKGELEEKIKDLEEEISDDTITLKMFISASPRDIVPDEVTDDDEGRLNWLINETSYLFEEIENKTILKYKLELYLNYLDENEDLGKMKSDCCNSGVDLVDHYHCKQCGNECNKSDYLNR